MRVKIKSIFEQIAEQVFKMTDATKAKTFIVEFHLNNENRVWPIISKLLNLGYSVRMVQNYYTTDNMGTLLAKK